MTEDLKIICGFEEGLSACLVSNCECCADNSVAKYVEELLRSQAKVSYRQGREKAIQDCIETLQYDERCKDDCPAVLRWQRAKLELNYELNKKY